MGVSYKLGVDAAIVLKYGGADQAVIKGLNRMGLPGLLREVIKLNEFRVDFAVEVTGEGSHGRFTFGGNLVTGDTKGQDQLKQYLKDNTKFTDCRWYLDLNDFIAPDLANDPDNAGFQVSKVEPGEAQKNGTFPLSGEMVTNGLYCYFVAHQTDDATPTMAFVTGTPATITDSGSGFVTSGFKAGQTLIVEGSTSNDGQYLIANVAAGTITLATGETLASEPAVDGTALHGGKL
ncbi:MAG: hypothetical protein OEV73_00480 [Desulfobulbaceae bacterium]|nr:hypothetical protein [Desulfobulbaceae bacterium]